MSGGVNAEKGSPTGAQWLLKASSEETQDLPVAQSPGDRVEGGPGWTLSQQAEEFFSE